MSQEQQDSYRAIIGNGQAKVTVGRDMSEMDFGSGGKVFVSVSLSCDQSQLGIMQAAGLAAAAADYFVDMHFKQMKQKCVEMHLLKPAQPERPQY